MSRYMIFDEYGNYFQYQCVDVLEALDKYVEENIVDIHISLDMWDKVKTCITDPLQRIELINQLTKEDCNRIDQVITNYDYIYGCKEECEE